MLRFSKYHGCGNDFVLIKWNDVKEKNKEELVRRLCDRHTGIGGDGCIFIKEFPLEMIYYNQDGSIATMCGNGIRCFAQYCLDEGVLSSSSFSIKTALRNYEVCIDQQHIIVNMGKPEFSAQSMAMNTECTEWLNMPINVMGKEYICSTCFVGTYHTVLFHHGLTIQEMNSIGKGVCEHPIFRQQTNVNFVEILSKDTLSVITYEKGVGLTLSCGTGCCASCAVLWKQQNSTLEFTVIQEKGTLYISKTDENDILLKGPAICVATGRTSIE